jgi:serine protease inhibitor ecotin
MTTDDTTVPQQRLMAYDDLYAPEDVEVAYRAWGAN